MENKNPEIREREITEFLFKEERKRDTRPFATKIVDSFIHSLIVLKERLSKIR
ncbi:MAG: hypothetical protein WA063_02650 [Minisyncoccia bacterium]